MRLAHLSDLHIGRDDLRREQALAHALIDHALDGGADHLLLGGDLVDHGNIEDLVPLRDHLARRGLLSPDRLSVVPGNHDIWPFGEGSLWRDAGRYLAENARALATLAAWPAQERYARFAELFQESFAGVAARPGDPYPCLKRVGGASLGLLDTTSNRGAFRSAAGRLDDDEAAWLLAQLALHPGPRLLLMHHWPFRWEIDTDAIVAGLPRPVTAALAALGAEPGSFADVNFEDLGAVQAFLQAGGFDAVLCGHLHMMSDDPRDPEFDVRLGEVPVHCMGRSGGVHQDPDRALLGYHVIDVGPQGARVETVLVAAADLLP